MRKLLTIYYLLFSIVRKVLKRCVYQTMLERPMTDRQWIGGQSLVELVVAIGLATIFIPALLTGMVAARSGRAQDNERTQATALVKEGQEIVRSIRNKDWATFASFATGQVFHPALNGTNWTLASGSESVNGFTRQIVINPVYRDGSGNIATSGTLDPSLEKVAVTVSWTSPLTSSITTTAYLARFTNISFLDSKVADFNAGTKSGIAVTDIYDGELELGGSGASDWCSPNSAGIVKYNLSGNGSWTAISAVAPNGATSGHAYTTFGFNQSGNPLDSVNITDASTPVVSAGSSFTSDAIKTYGLYADPTSNYVYLTSNSNKYQVDVVDATNMSTHVATFTSSGGEPGYSVYVATVNGTKTGFVTAADTTKGTYKLYSFSIGNATPIPSSLTQNGNPVTLAGIGYKVVVIGNYAFVATSSSTYPLQIFDVSNPSNMTLVKSFSVSSYQGSNPQPGVKLNVDSSGRYVFLATNYVDATHPDIFMIDVSTPTAPVVMGTANTYQNGASMNPMGIIPVSGNHMIVVGSGGQEYQVFYTYPTVKYCGGMSITSGSGTPQISAVAAVSETDGDNYAYILTNDSTGWFQIVPGGAGAGSGGGGGSGTFISQGIPVPNLTSNAFFNNFFPIADVPAPTTIAYQVGVAPTCSSSFTFVGPDGTTNTKFATASAIPLTGDPGYQNPGECFKYKVFMDSHGSNTLTPILYQVTVNYSP